MTNVYQPGDVVSILFTITDNATPPAPYDPAVVRFHYTDPSGADTLKVYGIDSVVTKVSTGVYRLLIYIPYSTTAYGQWDYDAQALDGSNNSLAVQVGLFVVMRLATLE